MALAPSDALCAQPLVPALGPVRRDFKPFWPPALVRQAPPAIILAALRRFGGPALLRGLRPSPSPGAPSWPSGLTLFGGAVRLCLTTTVVGIRCLVR